MLSWARNSAIYRLERRMMTERQLRDAITRKAKEKFEDISVQQTKALGDFAVKFAYEIKALDDTAFAEITVRSGLRSGKSKRGLAQKLTIKGVDRQTAEAALDETNDLVAAVVLPANGHSVPTAVLNWMKTKEQGTISLCAQRFFV